MHPKRLFKIKFTVGKSKLKSYKLYCQYREKREHVGLLKHCRENRKRIWSIQVVKTVNVYSL